MRKRSLCGLLALLLLCACAAPARESQTPEPEALDDPDGLAYLYIQAVLDSQADGEDYLSLPPEDREFYLTQVYGLPEDGWRGAAIYTGGGEDAREIAVVQLDAGQDAASAAQALEEYRQNRLADFVGYAPEQTAIVEKGRVVESGDWIALLICGDGAAAETALKERTGEAMPALEAETAGTPDPTPDPTPTPAPTEDPRFVKDSRGYLPFLPPNEVDMTLYDTAAILAAWAAGDPAGLGEKDAAIYARCREVFEEVVADGMTDFEKELALHDWIVDNGHYDQTVHDPATPEGLPHNKDPYGLLAEGYGICLGYAATFQLFMDLAGVECITVVGASGWSREDHAWNMVRLEGEWYGVDMTWDDTTITDPTAYSAQELSRRHHKYFNITSDELRSGNRQWDYDSVPEAAATRFRWDGVGPMPQ